MTQVQDALRNMTSDGVDMGSWLLNATLDPTPYLVELRKTVERLESTIDNTFIPRQRRDPEQVWGKWRETNYRFKTLDSVEIRTLCVSSKTAMRTPLIDALQDNSEALTSFRTLCGFVKAYFDQWRSMENPEKVEGLIQRMLKRGMIVRKSRVLDSWRKSTFLFSAQADKRIGEIVAREHRPLKDVCSDYFVDTAAPLASAAYQQAAFLTTAALIARQGTISEADALKELKWISENLLTSALTPDAYRATVGKLILSRLPDTLPLFQTALVDLIHADERLGDPRLPFSAPNWRAMPSGAKERFLAWLAKETLQFFFNTLVPKNDENRRRAEFWMEYAKKQGKIKDFQVAVSDEDIPKIRASRAQMIPAYSSIYGGRTSAFLMIFEGYGIDYVVIEFSETGNAVYIYTRNVFEATGVSLRSQLFHRRDDLLRMDDAQDRIIHRDSTYERWERKARAKLAELGIRP
jgi:hypothetical protein